MTESTLQSPLLRSLGLPHAFSTRHGGVSGGAFSTLNFGNPGELTPERRDPRENILRNWDLLKRAIIAAGSPAQVLDREIVEVHQVHGVAVCAVRRGEPTPRDITGHDIKSDAMVCDDPARLVAVRVADCTPVLIASGDGRVVATVHAGWRGVVGGIATRAVEAMRETGAAGELAAAIGPCIGPESFEVGPDVASEFERVFGAGTTHVRPGAPGKSLVDLKGALREQLIGAGVSPERVDVLPHCTVRDAADFFSHRRERGVTGRMVGIIGPRLHR